MPYNILTILYDVNTDANNILTDALQYPHFAW